MQKDQSKTDTLAAVASSELLADPCEYICKKCGTHTYLHPDCEPTDFCDLCAQEVATEALAACVAAWNALDNGKRKHHRDALTGRCIVGCQACAVDQLKSVIESANDDYATGRNIG